MENKTTEDSLRQQLREYQKRERRDRIAHTILSGAIVGTVFGVSFGNDLIGALVGALLGWFVGVKAQKERDEKSGK